MVVFEVGPTTARGNRRKDSRKIDEQIKLAADGRGDRKDSWGTSRLTGVIESGATED